ncbi:MAG: PD-(D/E)XK nuclease family transposase [Fretibacterium sp.]|nr:PD-(D/E)XK nuclease family transposase [Fretibacterium sp.]
MQEMLRVILGKDDLIVKKVRTQHFLKGFARFVYLDVYAVDSEGTIYNIEIQQEDEGADLRRPRFHGAMLDTHALKAGQDFKELPERYVIVITRNDVFGVGRPTGLTRRVSVAASGWSAVSERSAGRFVKAWPGGLRHP